MEKVIKIGVQEWMLENLNVKTFRNGDPIQEAKTEKEWVEAGENQQPAWCNYENDPEFGEEYGKLYNWYAVTDPRGLPPMGWRVPNDVDWGYTIDYLGGKEVAGKKMKSTILLKGNDQGSFTGLPGGGRNDEGKFYGLNSYYIWWTSERFARDTAYYFFLMYDSDGAYLGDRDKQHGLSVRCIRDF